MKNIFLFSILFSILFLSCETEVDVNAPWEDVTVVFGLLDQSQNEQYIRINKVFLGAESAMNMASVADSINYKPSDLLVRISKMNSSGDILSVRTLDTVMLFKDDGMFANDENIVYTFNNNDNFLDDSRSYFLEIENIKSGKIISGSTELIRPFQIQTYNHWFNNGIGLVNSQDLSLNSYKIEWLPSNGEIYQMTLLFNYTEYGLIDTVEKTIKKVYPIQNRSEEMDQNIDAQELLIHIENNIDDNNLVQARRFNDIDLVFNVGSSQLNTYITINEPSSSIVQERPGYTNMTNGIGIFSSRYTATVEGINLTSATKEAIRNNLSDLYFVYP